MGSATAPVAVGRALAPHTRRAEINPPFGASRCLRVRREGAPNCSRGGCAPPTCNCIAPDKSARSGDRAFRIGWICLSPVGRVPSRGWAVEFSNRLKYKIRMEIGKTIRTERGCVADQPQQLQTDDW